MAPAPLKNLFLSFSALAVPSEPLPTARIGKRSRLGLLIAGGLSLGLLAGCSVDHPVDIVTGAAYVPSNVHRETPKLPATLRRVAILPLATTLDEASDTAAREALEPLLQEELAKTGRFELVKVSSDLLLQRTGRRRWCADEKLPADFLGLLRETYACDAVFFPQVTVFRAYPPLSIGWRCKLVGVSSQGIPWAADEVFDAGQSSVVNGARRYQQSELKPGGPMDDSRSILSSPRRFGHYTASTLLATLPER
jgi:hypothetical protein